jgi:hypothetical protein
MKGVSNGISDLEPWVEPFYLHGSQDKGVCTLRPSPCGARPEQWAMING